MFSTRRNPGNPLLSRISFKTGNSEEPRKKTTRTEAVPVGRKRILATSAAVMVTQHVTTTYPPLLSAILKDGTN